ncbi:Predicted transcriptional regulator [Cedecea neteri]|uniref:DNA-binding protein n=1 Tax=Cedecea neteri TaxID=158822 RepID=A0A291E0X6_9ENTR|nr:helix-turn-helix domain-containing protein [Cedecea neteri]ATF93592.1 DNA-binding protein [Cedecea neteri]SQA96609.1 Predicted transcriptional regulator [Cedecea neteri]
MAEYTFTLVFTLPKGQKDPEKWVGALGAGRCDDALVGIGVTGRIALNFIREADSAEDALLSALRDVSGIIPGALLVEAAPDLVGLSDVAELLGVSRQYIRKVMVSREAFPAPVHDGKTALWNLEAVLRWMNSSGVKSIPSPLLDIAKVTRQCNLHRAMTDLNPVFQAKLNNL